MTWFERLRKWWHNKPQAIFDRSIVKNPLREFIYLDEVSLRSLLSSKTGEMTSTTSRQVSQTDINEIRDTASVSVASIGKLEATSRFQTQNSSTLQTAKKATVQSWFRELDQLENIRLIETVQQVVSFETTNQLTDCENPSVCISEKQLQRGQIIEFKVRLSTDPIFHMVTLFSEFKGMATDYPDMMADHGGLQQFQESEGISRVLQRLLAGLIPVRAEVLDYVVVELQDERYVVHVDAISKLDIPSEPLEIVCVTELDAYWKDIRRVLFSDAEFTILARISRSKLQSSWTPIKLADLMKGLVPDISEQLNNATRLVFDPKSATVSDVGSKPDFTEALLTYAQALLDGTEVSDTDTAVINTRIDLLNGSDQTVSEQKNAFTSVREIVSGFVDLEISPQLDLELREQAREKHGIQYFKSTSSDRVATTTTSSQTEDDKEAQKPLLDVEVVAMYW